MATFLLEILCEEIPAAALPGARRQLGHMLAERLREAGFGEPSVAVLSTSRRLAVTASTLPERQPDRSEKVVGPPVRVAVGDDGSPTAAGEGFARKVGLPFEAIERVATDKGEYLTATVVHPGRGTAEVLAEIVPAIADALRFPKMMRWGVGDHLFVRPVHGVVAMLDEAVVPLTLFGVAAGRATVGHRVHAPAAFDLETAGGYVAALERRRVMVEPSRRHERLTELAAKLADGADARVHHDASLVAEHVELVEWPGLVAGGFHEQYLELPREVVTTTLRHHQKCLVLEDGEGRLRPGFIAVVDRSDDPDGLVRQGNEWVIGARLADASFFFDEDRKHPLAASVGDLGRLEYHRALGSLADKAVRNAELAVAMADAAGLDVDGEVLRSTAPLAKADLLTHMVTEFPELQGVMGGHYLRLEGASFDLWSAVRDHYRPVGFEGPVPESVIGQLLGIADRLDTVAALFAVGERPSGSKDPYGLRRAAQGVVKIVAEMHWELDLEAAVREAVAAVATHSSEPSAELTAAVTDFVSERVRRWLVEVVGVAGDTADAVMASGWSDVPGAVARAQALENARTSGSFRSLALAFKRVRNITDGQPDAVVRPELFEQPEERELFEETTAFGSRLDTLLPKREIARAFAAMEPLADVLERFFVAVLVMCDDERLQRNRIAILKNLGQKFLQLADLSRLQVEGGDQ